MYVIGIDCGTTSLKGLAMNPQGEILTQYSVEYPTLRPHVGYSEQDPQLWIDATLDVLRKITVDLDKHSLTCKGISFSGQMHSMVLLDKAGTVIRPAILWNDVRTSKETYMLNTEYKDLVLDITKNSAVEGFTLPKLLWIKENEPENYHRIDQILLPKDYIRYILTDKYNMDYSDAAGTLMLDVTDKVWSEKLANVLEYNIEWLPPLVSSSSVVGNLQDTVRSLLNLNYDIPVIAGGADNACAALASGISDEQTALLSIGTSGVFLNNEQGYSDYSGKLHFFNNVMDSYYSMGVTLSAGDSLKWIRNIINEDLDYPTLLQNIKDIPCGSEGLLFTPYLSGERSPHFDADVRGSFIGLDTLHTKDHLLRSILEGITFSLKDSYDISTGLKGDTIEKIISVGGGAKNNDWLQIQADVFNKQIVTLTIEEGPGLGAAMLAAVGVHWFESFEACVDVCVQYDKAVSPIQDNVKTYQDIYSLYKDVYGVTKELSRKLTQFRAK